jgi:hypothetical protein
LTSALEGGEWLASRPGRFTPRERVPGTHWIGSWEKQQMFRKRSLQWYVPHWCWRSFTADIYVATAMNNATTATNYALAEEILELHVRKINVGSMISNQFVYFKQNYKIGEFKYLREYDYLRDLHSTTEQ